MKKSSNIIILTVLPLLFSVLLTSCGPKLTHLETAADLYDRGMYEEACAEFEAAYAEAPNDPLVPLGYAYNLYQLGRTNDVLSILVPLYDRLLASGEDDGVLKEAFTMIFDIYCDNGLYSYAADMCDEMGAKAVSEAEATEYRLRDAMLRAKRYKGSEEMFPAWVVAIRDVISLKTYAMDEYYELYSAYRARNMREDQLALADEMNAYIIGHSAYAESFDRMIDILFDAALISAYTQSAHTSEDYFAAAEKLIEMSAERNLPDEAQLKYKIILAERREKYELAYDLLGVYINRYPDDEAAIKEMDYLRVRLGVGATEETQ